MTRADNTQYILSLSYGKDSIACLAAIEKLGLPLDRIVHAEVWATDTIHADLPPMVEFKAKADAIIKERWGIEVEHICATRERERITFKRLFYKRRVRGNNPGKIRGFPAQGAPWCNSRLKVKAIQGIGEIDLREAVLPCPETKASESAAGGRSSDFRPPGSTGATGISNGTPCGFPLTRGSWCKKLKYGSYMRFPHLDHSGKLVHRTQTQGFQTAP